MAYTGALYKYQLPGRRFIKRGWEQYAIKFQFYFNYEASYNFDKLPVSSVALLSSPVGVVIISWLRGYGFVRDQFRIILPRCFNLAVTGVKPSRRVHVFMELHDRQHPRGSSF